MAMKGVPDSQPFGIKAFHEATQKVKELSTQGLSHIEIGRKLGIHPNTVKRLQKVHWGRPLGGKMPEEVRKYWREVERRRRMKKEAITHVL